MSFMKRDEIQTIVDDLGETFTFEIFMKRAFDVKYWWACIEFARFEVICIYRDHLFDRLMIISTDPDDYYSLHGWSKNYHKAIASDLLNVFEKYTQILMCTDENESVYHQLISTSATPSSRE